MKVARTLAAYGKVNRQLGWGVALLGLWLVLVGYYFLRQALDYRGIVAMLAEYQFLHFDRYWPTFTFLTLTVLCTTPLVALLWIVRQRQKRSEKLAAARIDDHRIMLGRLNRLQNFFAGIGAGCLICVGVILFQTLDLPPDDLTPRSIVIGSPDAIAPADGRAVLTGAVDIGETAQFNENLLLVKRTLYFAPIRSGPDDKAPLRYFVEVRRDDKTGRFHPIMFPEGDDLVYAWRFRVRDLAFTPYLDGMLRRHALPGEIIRLYRHAGYEVAPDTYVLFRSNEPIRWRHQMLAGEFLIVAVLAGLLALFFRRRRRVVRRLVRQEAEARVAAAIERKRA